MLRRLTLSSSPSFFSELNELEEKGLIAVHDRILVSDRVNVLLDMHMAVDGLEERELGGSSHDFRHCRRGTAANVYPRRSYRNNKTRYAHPQYSIPDYSFLLLSPHRKHSQISIAGTISVIVELATLFMQRCLTSVVGIGPCYQSSRAVRDGYDKGADYALTFPANWHQND